MDNYVKYSFDNHVFYKHKKPNFIYQGIAYNHGLNPVRIELDDNKHFVSEKFIGVSKSKYIRNKEGKVVHSKHITLLAAPEEFILKHKLKKIVVSKNKKKKQNEKN